MMKRNRKRALATAVLLTAFLSFGVSASDEVKNADIQRVAIDIDTAISTANRVVEGMVVEAELENEDGKLVWEIEIVGAGNVNSEVLIDAVTGSVLSVNLDD